MTNTELNANLKQLFNIFVFHCNKFNKCVLCHKEKSYYVDILCGNCLKKMNYKNKKGLDNPVGDLAEFLDKTCILCNNKRDKPCIICENCSKKYNTKRKEK